MTAPPYFLPHALMLLLLVAGSCCMASETDAPGRNPFARPAEAPAQVRPAAARGPGFSLRATMAAGAHSLANVDGEILKLGDVVEGYRLIAVGEGTAVFAKQGVHYSIEISQTSGDQ
ncbi:hypothetical protein BH24PSE2_BH24PSE2_14610 [soil metagenome]